MGFTIFLLRFHKYISYTPCIIFLFVQVNFSAYQYVMLPYCFGASPQVHLGNQPTGEHWMLLVADVVKRSVFVLRTETTCKYGQLKLANGWMGGRPQKRNAVCNQMVRAVGYSCSWYKH